MCVILYFSLKITHCSWVILGTRWFKFDRDWFVCKQAGYSPGHIWTTLYVLGLCVCVWRLCVMTVYVWDSSVAVNGCHFPNHYNPYTCKTDAFCFIIINYVCLQSVVVVMNRSQRWQLWKVCLVQYYGVHLGWNTFLLKWNNIYISSNTCISKL